MSKTISEWLIFSAGIHSVSFAIFHVFFWQLFSWKKELAKVNIATRAIIQILNIQLIFLLLYVAVMCFVFPKELLTTPFGQFTSACIGLFWLIRLIQQPIFLRLNVVAVHFLSLLFLVGTVLWLLPFFIN